MGERQAPLFQREPIYALPGFSSRFGWTSLTRRTGVDLFTRALTPSTDLVIKHMASGARGAGTGDRIDQWLFRLSPDDRALREPAGER